MTSQSTDKKRLLVVDDDMGMQSLLSDVLSSIGYTVISCSDAEQAMSVVSSGAISIDAIISDLNMPKINGMEFLVLLQKMKLNIPLILITAFGTAKTASDARAKGAFGYLSKPFQLSEIRDLIQKAVGGSSSSYRPARGGI